VCYLCVSYAQHSGMDTVNVQSINFVQSSCKALSAAELNILCQNALVLPETAGHFSDHRAVSASNINKNKRFLVFGYSQSAKTFARSQNFKTFCAVNTL
jgi:hypothetical protein